MVNSRVFAIGFRDVDLAVRVLVLAEASRQHVLLGRGELLKRPGLCHFSGFGA